MTGEKQLAVYLRLSLEDRLENADGKGVPEESNSISNQRKLIQEFICCKPELSGYETVEFCDDGYSGTSMDRPGMQKLLREIKKNRIACIVVKDMSRFSRDYIELGTYLNQIFPFMGIRFLSINDHYDSNEHKGSTIAVDTAFQTLLYDLYSKDISIKIKAAIQSRCKRGEYVFGQVPFGYEKDKIIKNAVVVNEREAKIVRRIFFLASEGKSSTQIAKRLMEEKVPTAIQMRYPEREGKKNLTWSAEMVRRILNNRFYLGEMIYGKRAAERVGSKKLIAALKQDWKTIPDHHEPLVTPEMFSLVSSFRPEQSTERKRPRHPLVGKISCGGCGYSLNYKPSSKSSPYPYFWCRKHSLLQIPDCCVYFHAGILEETVLLLLNEELMKRGDAAKQRESLEQFQKAGLKTLAKMQVDKKKQHRRLSGEREGLYVLYRQGQITAAEYRHRADELDGQLAFLKAEMQKTEQEYGCMKEEYEREKQDMKQIIRCSHLEELTQEAADVFIKRIHVYGKKRIEIEWNFTEGSGQSGAKAT